ncbi:hypothetical protein [Allorhodopirellula solitaria]|uniref:hypothetical protein n=1 Tax=Allorhodopirellula solitaria TaxID=2527987 RepID=UPI0011B59C06|nr:hypothetical protein [Allorhodopirellula solitaria]
MVDSAAVGVLVWMAGGNRPYLLTNQFSDLDSDAAILADGCLDEFSVAAACHRRAGSHRPCALVDSAAVGVVVWMAGGNRPYSLANQLSGLDSDAAILAVGCLGEFSVAAACHRRAGSYRPCALVVRRSWLCRDGWLVESGPMSS